MDRRVNVQASTIEETQAWSSVVLKDTLSLDHAVADIETKRILYHLHL
ncbi:hypothetical protein PC128_g25116 [Phytophthora cactorum]|nr:hypothetical protein PC120_g24514 [Phytophthora cactorum]KAG3043302.1 hypothetical protein PC121_g22636 [Phytophthora cactorum]KAG3140785.1 hypothetical protein PC128_g25116 [Phytophthora cactorum]KAG4039395.1 hypothetical protein PC123_g25056 [Phytophthora cactorum]